MSVFASPAASTAAQDTSAAPGYVCRAAACLPAAGQLASALAGLPELTRLAGPGRQRSRPRH
jgi:hypothetical protein